VNLPFLTLTLSLGRWCSAGAGVVAAGRDRRVGRRRPGAARQRWLPSCSPRPRSQAGGPGKSAAFRTGFAAASGDIIAAFDADGSTDPAEIRGYVGAVCAGADLPTVRGSFRRVRDRNGHECPRSPCGSPGLVEVASVESKRVIGTAKLKAFVEGWRVLTLLQEQSPPSAARTRGKPTARAKSSTLASVLLERVRRAEDSSSRR
jgi:hypothetical protein